MKCYASADFIDMNEQCDYKLQKDLDSQTTEYKERKREVIA